MRSDCSRCNGTGWQVRPTSGGPARAYAERCPCVQEASGRQRLLHARIPRKFAEATFQSFEVDGTASHNAMDTCRRLIESYPANKRGVLLMGTSGVGKTHLAVATLKGLLQKGADGLFYDFRDLLDELRVSYEPGGASEGAILHRVFTVEVLVLDELGSEKLTDWVREIVHRVIIRRYNDERLTICTTNYLDRAHFDKEPDPLETLEGRIGYRLRSRLYEMCDTLALGGRDFRRQEERSEKLRNTMQAAALTPEAEELSLEDCEKSFASLPASEQQPFLEQAREKYRGVAVLNRQIEQKALELYREELLRALREA